jgi:hypothetical protein
MFENLKAKRDEIVAGGVALSAFAASAQHIYHVTQAAGNPAVVAALHPAGIDGLIYIGIRAMQGGNKKAGGFAVAYGAAYSLTFNAASYGAFKMPTYLLAACMPLAMFFAFLIVHGGHAKVAEVTERIVEVVKEVQVLPALLPIVPLAPKPAPLPRPVATTSGRVARWDVEKAVAMILDGKTDVDIMAVVDVTAKPLQRTKRCVQMLKSGVDASEAASTIPLSLAHVLRVQAAMQDAS